MQNEKKIGVIYAVIAYTLWGILPLYWKLVDSVFSMEILANRIVWAFAFTIVIIGVIKQWEELKCIVKNKKQMLYILIASILIAFNWGLYIWAVNSDKIVDASLGYYINPLLAVALGVIIFKEKLSLLQGGALFVAFIGVMIKTIQYGRIPWISLGLAISFALYGATKKSIKANSIVGLTLETTMLTPVALLYIASRQLNGVSAFQTEGLAVNLLLIGAGVVTAIPLLLFASGARRLPMSLIGFTQYISPTISLFIGVFVYHESFTAVDMISFCFIWCALAIYSISQIRIVSSKNYIDQVN
ncbi:EamA family transporter RarD [Anaeromicropila herbilytica]|uniref:EamA family transporter n=1 Tax=Anaeromicropila herbilytica TaxID=2785025 RepID=A0A7R7IDS9_9FIRM|nr:EamA family transporter RarD [Anaeromicropila herbilytica]BCN31867.1 EamA family transporter [Anaeromicropila herbilytica]